MHPIPLSVPACVSLVSAVVIAQNRNETKRNNKVGSLAVLTRPVITIAFPFVSVHCPTNVAPTGHDRAYLPRDHALALAPL